MNRLTLSCAIAVAGLASGARAQLIAYDGFNNGPRPDLAGSAGGFGWTTPWDGSVTMLVTSIASPGLTFPGLATVAGAAQTDPQTFYPDTANYYRSFAPIIGSSHLYMSFLIRPGTQYTTLGAGIRWGGYPNWIVCGAPDGSNYGFHIGRYTYVYSNAPVVQGQVALIVMDMEVTGNQTVYRMYINHTIGQPQPGFPDAQYTVGGAAAFPSTLELFNDGDFTTDELRVGTTWASVVPSPCYANCDGSAAVPVLSANDFQCFLNEFAAGAPYANCDGSTATPILTANDFQCFLNTFAAGCP